MIQYHTIGKNFETTLKKINDPISEYYVPPAVASMTPAMLRDNAKKLSDQIAYWVDQLNGANKASGANITAIIDNQTAKLDQYQTLLERPGNEGQPGSPNTPGAPALPAAQGGNDGGVNWWLIGGAAAALMFLFKRN